MQNAFKILLNSFYGYYGHAMARVYIPEMAGAVTSYGRENILKTRDIIEKEISDLKKIKIRVELDDIPLGEYDNIWDEIEDIYLRAMYKIKTDKRELIRDLIFFILGIASGIFISLLGKWLVS